jgi:hypothetical protein
MISCCSTVSAGGMFQLAAKRVVNEGTASLQVRLCCDSMELAADIVQDLARHFKVDELESEADFPEEFKEFEEVGPYLFVCLFDGLYTVVIM